MGEDQSIYARGESVEDTEGHSEVYIWTLSRVWNTTTLLYKLLSGPGARPRRRIIRNPCTENTLKHRPEARHHGRGEVEKIWLSLKGPPSNYDFKISSNYEEIS